MTFVFLSTAGRAIIGLLLLVLMPEIALAAQPATPPADTAPLTVGWVEKIDVPAIDSRFKAKLDTGATTSSLRADVLNYTGTPRTDTRRVIFQVENDKGELATLERRLVRYAHIKAKEGGMQRRPVVEMEFCVAGRIITSEVNLAPRADFLYPVLIGRNMMQAGHLVIDPSRTFINDAHCNAAVTPEAETNVTPGHGADE